MNGPGPFLAPGACVERSSLLTVRDRFRSGSSFEESSILTVRDRFWPWEPGLIEERISSLGPS